MKKIFLTSAICMIVAMPSYADIASDASSATCDSTTIGATENNTDLEALWTAAQYTEPAGQYLLFANNTVSQHQTCPAGSYCPGFTNQTFADASMGLQTCPTGYTNSAAGASADTQCYRACNISNMGTGEGKTISPIAHATAISGNDYYGAGTDTCVATTCEAGYSPTGLPDGDGPLKSYVSTNGSGYAAKRSGYNDSTNGGATAATYGLTQAGEWGTSWSDGTTVKGHSLCSTTDGQSLGTVGTPNQTEGYYCWCQMDNYKIAGGATQTVSSSSWVYASDSDGAVSDCYEYCSDECADYAKRYSNFRTGLFGALGAETHSCEANTISITWDPKNGDATTTNQCTYGGSVTLPATPSKPGYIFGGWKVKAYVSCASQTTQADCNSRGDCSWYSNKCSVNDCYELNENSCKAETNTCVWYTDHCAVIGEPM